MVRNQTLSSTVSATVSAELTTSLRQTLSGQRLRSLEQLIALPGSLRAFALLLLGVGLICGGMTLLIMLSVQIYQINHQVSQLQLEHQAIERQNAELVWAIAQHSSLAQIQQRSLALGYEVPQARHYVDTPVLSAGATFDHQAQPTTPVNAAPIVASPEVAAPAPNLFDRLQQQMHTLTSWLQR